ncbi:N-terminal binuclear Zn cluster-containing DNA binding domain-containing [Fusarium albosuccineum]|uniref:N-terminal binuclear Zn cluster-containing DNA binding domain-containing n=1 Tax=Fusarium albosuccineum TaxID=1237068 RepID=A0A8H4L2G9_9HYPO|nr:N-terminal binuclear Zn cluster-containing DNA binding domain-containing [Fusarium albosuccineum]
MPKEQSCIERAADTGLAAMEVCKDFFELCFPQQAKYFMVSFCPFDVAALLFSLLRGDKDRTLARRREIVDAVGSALSISFQLRGHTKMADSTSAILNALVSQLQLSSDESETLRDWTKASGQNVLESQHTRLGGGDTEIQSSTLPDGPATTSQDQWQNEDMVFDTDIGFDFDLGVLEGVWDWPTVSQ